MATARPWIRALFSCRERSRHGIATISVRRSRPETGAAEFAKAVGWLGLPGATGAHLQGEDVRGEAFRDRPLSCLPFLSS